MLDPRHERLGWIGIEVERAKANRIGELANDVESVDVGREAPEPVGTIGHEQVVVGFDELIERLPACGRGLRAHQAFERRRSVAGRGEFLDQRAQLVALCWIAREVEPRQIATLSLALRESRDFALDGGFHQRQDVPRHRAPRRRHQPILMLVGRDGVDIDLHDWRAIGEDEIGDRELRFLHANDADTLEAVPHQAGRGGNLGIEGRCGGRATPSVRKGVRVDQVGGLHFAAVLEWRCQDAVDDFGHCAPGGAGRNEPTGVELWHQGIGRDTDGLPHRLLRRPNLRAIGSPQTVVRDGQKRIVADDRPHQPAGRVREPGNRVPGCGCADVNAQPEPAVPRQILQLERPQDDG